MHSCIQTSSIQIDSKCMQTFTAQSWTLQCHQDMSKKCSRLRIYLQIFMVTVKQIPTDNSLTASTNVLSMQYPNIILNTKTSIGRANWCSLTRAFFRWPESRIPNCFTKECQHWILQSRICTLPSRIRTLYHFSSFIQICTKPEAFLLTSQKYWIFPQEQSWNKMVKLFGATQNCDLSRVDRPPCIRSKRDLLQEFRE